MDWNARLERILRQLVCRSFPELRRLRIGIGFDDLEPGNCLEYYTLDGRFGIAVSPLLKEAPRKALVGGIAHELAHIVRDHRLGPLQRDWAFERFASSRTYRFREERATDRRAVAARIWPALNGPGGVCAKDRDSIRTRERAADQRDCLFTSADSRPRLLIGPREDGLREECRNISSPSCIGLNSRFLAP